MSSTQKKTIMIMAGGTGGHVFPGLAVADCLRDRGWNVVWLGSPAGMEAKLVATHGYVMAPVQFTGLRGKGIEAVVLLPMRLLRAFWQGFRALRAHRPNVVLGMGGYVAFPGGMMAAFTGAPLAVHEQNSIAGLTNRVLARYADKVLAGFPNALPGAIEVGNPVREGIARMSPPDEHYAGRSGPLRILVVGDSTAEATGAGLVAWAAANPHYAQVSVEALVPDTVSGSAPESAPERAPDPVQRVGAVVGAGGGSGSGAAPGARRRRCRCRTRYG